MRLCRINAKTSNELSVCFNPKLIKADLLVWLVHSSYRSSDSMFCTWSLIHFTLLYIWLTLFSCFPHDATLVCCKCNIVWLLLFIVDEMCNNSTAVCCESEWTERVRLKSDVSWICIKKNSISSLSVLKLICWLSSCFCYINKRVTASVAHCLMLRVWQVDMCEERYSLYFVFQ